MKKDQTAAPPKTKSIHRENLERGQRANTGGDQYSRSLGRYAKEKKTKDTDPLDRL